MTLIGVVTMMPTFADRHYGTWVAQFQKLEIASRATANFAKPCLHSPFRARTHQVLNIFIREETLWLWAPTRASDLSCAPERPIEPLIVPPLSEHHRQPTSEVGVHAKRPDNRRLALHTARKDGFDELCKAEQPLQRPSNHNWRVWPRNRSSHLTVPPRPRHLAPSTAPSRNKKVPT